VSGAELDTGTPWALDTEPWESLTLEMDWPTLEVEYEPLEVDWSFLDIEPDYAPARAAYTEPDYPQPPGAGRKGPRLSDPRVQRCLEGLESGLFIYEAARWAGIGERTARRWIARGRSDEATGTPSSYLQFWQAAQAAQAIATDRALRVINTAIRGGNWRAAAWLLERRWSKNWGNPHPPRPGPAQRARMAGTPRGAR